MYVYVCMYEASLKVQLEALTRQSKALQEQLVRACVCMDVCVYVYICMLCMYVCMYKASLKVQLEALTR
jgi:ferredoxin